MRSLRLPTRLRARRRGLAALVATVAILSALAAPALDPPARAVDPIRGVSRHPSARDAAHLASSGPRTTNRVDPGAAVVPLLAVAFALALVACCGFVRRRRFHATTWRLAWSRGPPVAARTAPAATFA